MTSGNESSILAATMMKTGFWLSLIRLFQVAVICLTIGLFIISIPLNYERRSSVCRAEPCPLDQITPSVEEALNQIGMTARSFAALTIAFDIFVAFTFTVCAVVIFIRKPNDFFTIFVTVMLVTFGVATFTAGVRGVEVAYPWLGPLVETIAFLGNCSLLAFFFLFPNGRFAPPRWSVVITVAWIIFQLPRYYFPDSVLNLQHHPSAYNTVFSLGLLSGIFAQVHRYRHISSSVERQQSKWVMYGLTIGAGGYMIARLLSLIVPNPSGGGFPTLIVLNIAAIFFILLIPVSIAVAVVRYRLWDINPLINRTLVYGALSALAIALYVVAVGVVARYVQGANNIISFIATGVIAILFEPLRERLQGMVNRLMYGERDDPATVLTQLSQGVDSALVPDAVLQTIVDTLAQTLRLPYVAISLLDEKRRFTSTSNLPLSELLQFPLNYQSETVGELTLATRAVGESFSSEDLKLINLIARQAGVAAYTLRLNNDLQHSRERLVTAQEEERRRLRRDLHDGIGPTLASFTQRLETVDELLHSGPQKNREKIHQMIHVLQDHVAETVAEIRRLVYALRPPVLDEFGLVSAIREHTAQYSRPNGMAITFDVTEPMPVLSAAVEVAAYRIVLEAFTNVIRHAHASECRIRLKVEKDALTVEVSDNGRGIPAANRSGVGLNSMRERAGELGGACIIENSLSGGTKVHASLPMINSTGSFHLQGTLIENQKEEN